MRSYLPRPELSGIETSGPANERYEILGRIASGAMGQVFLARMRLRSGVTKTVVLKRIRPELQLERGAVEMFYDEAHIASQMDHPNIIRIFELGEIDGSLFISMELVEGVNLSGLLRHLVAQDHRLPAPVMLKVTLDVLDALAYAHAFTDKDGRPLNIVHRDVSPQNIMVSFDGEVKLFDFGVTKAEGRLHKTHPGLLKGKLAYMSPEQILADGNIDGRADLFSLGVLLYESLLFRHPFYGRTDAMVLKAIMEDDPIHPHAIDPNFSLELTEIIARSLAKDADDRYRSAEQMAEALENYMQSGRITTSRRMVARFIHREMGDRIEAIDRARGSNSDPELVEALRDGTTSSSSRGAAQKNAPPPPRADPIRLGAPQAQRLLTPPSPARAPKKPLLLPAGMDANLSQTGLHLAEAATGDLLPSIEDSTGDAPQVSRSSLDDVLADALFAEGAAPSGLGTLGDYTLLERIPTSGPFGEYSARKQGPRGFVRPVRILRLPVDRAHDEALTEQLVECARASAQWTHPNLVQTLDFGNDNGLFWVTEHVEGRTLEAVYAQARRMHRAVLPQAACRIAAEICAALLHMHRHDSGTWIHGDVRPQNVVITTSGTIKLRGFEYARLEESGAATQRPMPNAFSAPELHRGEPPGPEADLYGVGRLLDEGLSLQRRESRQGFEHEPSPSLATRSRDVPARVIRIVDAALVPTPRARGDDIAVLWEELERALVDLERPFTSLDLRRWVAALYA